MVEVTGAETAVGVVVGIVVVVVSVCVGGVVVVIACQSWVVVGVCGAQTLTPY